MVYMIDLKSIVLTDMRVRLPPRPPVKYFDQELPTTLVFSYDDVDIAIERIAKR